MRQQQPVPKRRAAFPRTFSFNKIVALDYFYISWDNRTLAFLNVICHGTNLQQVGFLKSYDGGTPSSRSTWRLFHELWVRPFGLPETMLTDGGGEFRYEFERAAEQCGIMQIISDSHSPWQNGRCERHGGWVKQRLEQELQSGHSVVANAEDLDMLLASLVSHKNRWFHRGGYSPYQLTFGINPRVPIELLSDDSLQEAGVSDITADGFEQDSAAAEFNRAHAIRQRARELCVSDVARNKIRLSSQGQLHKQRQWFPGQWVFVWRRFSGTGQGHVTRCRWTGPGLVLLQSGHTVWVSMRARLLKCNSDQLRPATHDESVGAELRRSGDIKELLQQTSSHRAGAVDVAAEGPPGAEAWDEPIVHETAPAVVPGPPEHEALPSIQEEEETSQHIATDSGSANRPQQLLRDIGPIATAPATPLPGVPAPATPLPRVLPRRRQVSAQTVEEPNLEPTPEASGNESSEAGAEKRRKTEQTKNEKKRPGRDVTESEKLERIALRELRRLRREDQERKNVSTTSSSDIATSSTQVASAATADDGLEARVPDEPALLEEDEADNSLLSFLEISRLDDQNLMAMPAKSRNSEFNMREATVEDRVGFRESDISEWENIKNMGAIKIHRGRESAELKQRFPHRVITSRMIRRKKPTPGVGNFKYKSRWCVHGHRDPDSDQLRTYSPMPSTEAISMFSRFASISHC